jgi:hypothetical protein
MNRKDRRTAEARSKTNGTAEAAERERMSLIMRSKDGIRRSHDAARATLGTDVVVVIADPTDPLGRALSVDAQRSEENGDAVIAPEANGRATRVILGTLRRDDALRLLEPERSVVGRALRAWSPDTGRILVMCAWAGGVTVTELGLSDGDGADAKRIRADILQQSVYGITRTRMEAMTQGIKAVVIIVADTRDPTGRAVALSSGMPAASVDAMIASAVAKGGLPIFIVGKPRDEVIQSLQRSLPVIAAILKNWSPAGHEFPACAFG